MVLFPSVNFALHILGCLGFTGVFSVLVLPEIVFAIGYLLPKTIGYVSAHQVQRSLLWVLIRKPLFLVACFALLGAVAFLLSPETAYYLVASPPALFCWALAVPAIIRMFTTRKDDRLSDYYLNLYTLYFTKNEREKYERFVDAVSHYSIDQAQEMLSRPDLSFLERKVLGERVLRLG